MPNNIRERFNNLKSRKVSSENIQKVQVDLLEESTLDRNYIVLIIGSCALAKRLRRRFATLGLLSNSAAVIIGAMIVAPLMLPIRGLAFGALEGNVLLFRKGLTAIVVGSLTAIFLAWLLGSLVRLPEFGSEVLARSRPTLLDLGIAVAAGAISGFAKVEPKISSTLAGTAMPAARTCVLRCCSDAASLRHRFGFISSRLVIKSGCNTIVPN